MNKNRYLYLSFIISLLCHIIFLMIYEVNILKISLSDNNYYTEKTNVLKIKILKKIVNTEKSDKFDPKKKHFLGKDNNTFDKQQNTKNRSNFKRKQKKIEIKDLSLKKDFIYKKEEYGDRNFIEEFESGDRVQFNTIRYQYYSFFKRIQDNLGNNWKLTLDRFSSRLRYQNKILITIDEKGYLLRLKIIESSGNDFFDKTTIDALNKASPFINPPKGLININKKASFEWVFVYN